MHASPPLPGCDAALFLDFDGTLVAIAETPEAVQVPAQLVPLLTELRERLGGALAVVSGREIDAIDRFLAPLRLATAGEHGVQRRDASGRMRESPAPDLSAVRDAANGLAARHPGLLVECKHAAVALHYRLAPDLGPLCLDTMITAIGAQPQFELLHGKCVVEVKPAGVSKGMAIAAFLREPPFEGRSPFFAGDDTTDESGFAAVQAHSGGVGIKVGQGATQAARRLADPAAVLAWLQAARDGLVAGAAGNGAAADPAAPSS